MNRALVLAEKIAAGGEVLIRSADGTVRQVIFL